MDKTTIEQSAKRLSEVQPSLNAVVTFAELPDEISTQGKLAGIPVVLKDNIITNGLRTTASSGILDNYIPVYDSIVAKRLKEAGAVIMAKASMDELGMGGTNRNAFTGPVHNPYDLDRISGGSSGGSAVLVASKAVPLAIGTDTGDSIRKPAAFCGVVGFKPTYGRIPRYGIIPYASSLDTVGTFTRSVKDAALALEVLAGRDDHDMTSSYEEVGEYSELLNDDLKGKKIGILRTVSDEIKNPDIKAAFDQLVDDLKNAGAIVSDLEMDRKLLELIAPVYKTIANAEATANHSNLDGIRFGVRKPGESVEDVMTASRTEGFSSYVRARFVIGSYSLFEENQDRLFRKAQKIRRLISEAYARLFEDQDVVLTIAAPDVAPKIEETSEVRFGIDRFEEEHMQLANFTGYPSIVLPLGLSDGLPFGVELTARPFEEQKLLDTAAGVEKVIDFQGEPTL
ncbi:amidase [Ileibacterium valens]|uniref:Aspartyl-tRNA amidotransferase n=1 Tax=Ileibacterium valens TaxID=1862668 RepID=A0A1U7NG67_9FIRM|nr:amidase family protein [Ileibacterium valens]OLU38709.1 aspartyl-tRNA amidotransferase [Erysipelotrichaceae bacterium NYU-BL-F16]OLU39896.1 aspartyl-tRNA amidotransferase [Ileibacterium valens]OLU41508.1 aspartyl-tRNA amidotransferase [Erysipelotrichaceae bacterium NYU-BL-E8]